MRSKMLEGGRRGDGHEVSILIRARRRCRAGRGPSNVSTMIIRPPQHGQRRAGERSSARLSASAGEGWGAFSVAASICLARSMLSSANRAGEQAVVADAVEAGRQHVQEKAADELGGVERHGLEAVAAFDPVVLPLEGDALLVERDQPGVGDRDAVGVAGEIGEHGLRPGERPLGVDDPFGAAQRRERGVEGGLSASGARSPKKAQIGRPHGGRRALRGRAGGTGATARAPAGRSRACRRSSATRPATGRRRER